MLAGSRLAPAQALHLLSPASASDAKNSIIRDLASHDTIKIRRLSQQISKFLSTSGNPISLPFEILVTNV